MEVLALPGVEREARLLHEVMEERCDRVAAMFRSAVAAVLLLTLAHCDTPKTPPKGSADRVAKAEAAMAECKKKQGLEAIPTPVGVVLDDPATRGQALICNLPGSSDRTRPTGGARC